MNPFDTIGICPYTGLRSFTEEESLYFKGRDLQVDQITALLEQNKFLMVTGASGEGKSSLIYAGLVPNARAGFFKAKYTNWVVADFRPERSPVANMAKAIAEKFDAKPSSVETELRRGFSSLIDLYTNSDFYTDEDDEQWTQLAESDKKDKRRKAANLMILVDQFEEFFTNPENFFNEAPSQDSQIVVNLILETARIAIKRNLPVYVVCTMRSDYIGQCSAFRGLPEYIGFSQFFVPRLKRKDLKQVIEEPAILSGNRISQRLIERLVYDLSEGVDQLPILQHALSQIWLAANHGRQEMDLIHYAMVGGMPADELPDEDQLMFSKWFKNLPEHQRNYYKETSLSKVIEIHASVLYENAWSYYNKQHPDKPITQGVAKRIIALTFSCLTKIDNSRAVRNRMSLGEIAEIINTPELTYEMIGGVLNIYREEGNSFIRPFKTEDSVTHTLSPETVLDITHESLIRNWTKLNKWASQEFEFYSTYLDFKKQLDRWKNSGKNSAYLLPIGPLSYFENWYATCKPNVAWIRRYAEVQENKANATESASIVLTDIREFLKRSARNVMVSRAFMKYGPQRIATVLAVIIMLIMSGFYWYDAEQKKNKRVLEQVRNRANTLLTSAEVTTSAKALYLLMEERLESGSNEKHLNTFVVKDRISLAIEEYEILLEFNKKDTSKLKHSLIRYIGTNLLDLVAQDKEYDFLLENVNKFVIRLSYDTYYNPGGAVQKTQKDFTNVGYSLVEKYFTDKKLVRPTIGIELNLAIQFWLTTNPTQEGVRNLLAMISPLSGPDAKVTFETYYPKGSFEPNGRIGMDYNGGYHTLASLYAATGDEKSVLWCFEQLIQNNQRDYFGTGRLFNNYTNILGYLYQFGHKDKAQVLVDWLSKNDLSDNPYAIYRNIIIRSAYLSRYFPINIDRSFLRSNRGYFYPNLCLLDRSVYAELMTDLNREIQKYSEPNQRNFQLAMSRKRQAIFEWKYSYDRGIALDQSVTDKLFDEAFAYFKLVDANFLEESTSITIPYVTDGYRERNQSRKHLFLYPDYMDGWFSNTYHTDLFFRYLNRKNLLLEYFTSANELELIDWWLAKAYEKKPPFFANGNFDNHYEIPKEVLAQVVTFLEKHPERNQFDATLIYLVTSNRYYASGDSETGKLFGDRFIKDNVPQYAEKYGYIERTFLYNEVKDRSIYLAKNGFKEEAIGLAERFPKESEKAFAYIFIAKALYETNTSPEAFIYLDSALSKIEMLDIATLLPPIDPRFSFVKFVSQIGSEPINRIAFDLLRQYPEDVKQFVYYHLINGIAAEGNYYRAYTAIPQTFTESADLESLTFILWEVCKKKELEAGDVRWNSMDKNFFIDKAWSYLQYFQPF
jgi:energy-coupling factor transporter ATP-binding protein EcfA2